MSRSMRILAAGLCVLLSGVQSACERAEPVVQTQSGAVRGAMLDGVMAFKGIPFAAPPVGEWRWRPPQPVEPWQGVRDATAYGMFCAQPPSEVLWFELTEVSEDCLTLNVWTPDLQPADKLPVMVWIHGGGYLQGSGNIPRLNSPTLASEGAVLVTINYRLHLFGFMTHPALSESHPDELQGNFGMMDAVAALEWVQANIAAFGGDADNVTIFGESAGAGMVNYLMAIPRSAGLFHRAISQSSSEGLVPNPHISKKMGFDPPGYELGQKFVKKLDLPEDVDTATALRALTTDQLLAAVVPRDRFTPVIDGKMVPDHIGAIFMDGRQHAVPYMNGGNTWEASLGRQLSEVSNGAFSPAFAGRLVNDEDKARLYPGLSGDDLDDQIFADLVVHSATQYRSQRMDAIGQPVYSYFFSYLAEARRDTQPGPAHADDIAFVMGTLDTEKDLDVISDRDREVSDLMRSYWLQFARTGNPNRPGLPEWPAYSKEGGEVLEIGDEVLAHQQFMVERREFHMNRGLGMLNQAR